MAPWKKRVKREEPDSGEDDDKSEEYRTKRDRNNQAVKRSRVKSKMKTQETVDRVNRLRDENTILEEKVNVLTRELNFLKEVFLAHAANDADAKKKFQGIDLQHLLKDDENTSRNTNQLLRLEDNSNDSSLLI